MPSPTRQDFFDLLARTTEPEWLAGMLGVPDSLATLNAFADIWIQAGVSSTEAYDAALISRAPTGNLGTCLLTLSRVAPAGAVAVTIPKGYKFITPQGIELYAVMNVTVAAAQTSILIPLESGRKTELVNTLGHDAFQGMAVGQLGDPRLMVADDSPIIADAAKYLLAPLSKLPGVIGQMSTRYELSTPIAKATADWLSLHGLERGQLRQAYESADEYRKRVRSLQDSISPVAIVAATKGVAQRLNISDIKLLEPYNGQETTALRESLGLLFSDSYYFTDNVINPLDRDYWDDPLSKVIIGGQQLPREVVDFRTGRAYFRVEVGPYIPAPDWLGLYFDGGAIGGRFFSDPLLPTVWPGPSPASYFDFTPHPEVMSALMAITEETRRKRAAGIQTDTYITGAKYVVDAGGLMHGTGNAAGLAVLITFVAPVTKQWWINDIVAIHGEQNDAIPPPFYARYHFLRFTFVGGGTWDSAPWRTNEAEHLTLENLLAQGFPYAPITRVDGFFDGNGANTYNLTVQLRVLEGAR